MIKSEPVDIEELTKKRSRRGRKRKTTESENELTLSYEREDNEYKRKRLRNNIAVRKSRDKGKADLYFNVCESILNGGLKNRFKFMLNVKIIFGFTYL